MVDLYRSLSDEDADTRRQRLAAAGVSTDDVVMSFTSKGNDALLTSLDIPGCKNDTFALWIYHDTIILHLMTKPDIDVLSSIYSIDW